jgi:ABC-2 type transport system ATP-binding protein
MIEVLGISKKYGNKIAVEDVSFTAENGQILGLLGRNGAGKSTTMNIMTGYISSDAGTARIDGHDILEEPLEAKKRIGYLPEHPPLYLEMTVYEYLSFVCQLKGVKKDEQKGHLEEILGRIRIDDVRGRLVGNLSKGYRQRVGLAGALCGSPDTIIMDEPTVGLDPMQIIEIRNIIKELGKTHTIILSSHILKEIADICTHVVILNNGRKVADGSMQELLQTSDGKRATLIRVSSGNGSFLPELQAVPGVEEVKDLGEKEKGFTDYEITSPVDADLREELFIKVCKAGRTLLMLRSAALTLEDVFTRLTLEDDEERAV